MHIQQALVHLDIVVQHLPISRHIKPSTGKFVSKEFQVLIIVHLSRILVDQTGSVLTVELVLFQHVQLTQLSQDIAPLATHQLNAQLVSLAFHTTPHKTQLQIIVLFAKLDHAVLQSAMTHKFHFLMVYVCLMMLTPLLVAAGLVLQIIHHTHQCKCSNVELAITIQTVISSQEHSQILSLSNGLLSLHS